MSTVTRSPLVGLSESIDPLPPARPGLWMRIVRTAIAVSMVIGSLIGIVWAGAAWERHQSFAGLKPATYGDLEQVQVTSTKREFSIGVGWLRYPGEDIQVLNVSALTSSNLDYIGASTVWPREIDRPSGFGAGFLVRGLKIRHPVGEMVPARETAWIEYTGQAPEAVRVLASFRLRSGDLAGINGLMMTYRVGGRTKTEVLNSAAIVCLSPKLAKDLLTGECHVPADAPNDWVDQALYGFGLLPKENIGDDYNNADY